MASNCDGWHAPPNLISTCAQSQTMNYYSKRTAGLLFVVGVVEYILAIIISEAIHPGYSVGRQYLSDLGDWSLVGNSALIFNTSVILYGLFVIVGACFIWRGFRNGLFASLLAINGVGSVVLGLVAQNISPLVHSDFALVAFFAVAISAIVSHKFVKSPFSQASVVLGAVSFLAIVLFVLGHRSSVAFLGIGIGGMERFIVYPTLLWMLGFGAHLIGDSIDTA